ncbi:MAG: hypothetical protein BWK78_06030 [Thiotrichaceae bacterium IS1]|nr:MAG: hypothetical protein BWK78_06030 [Thiotrichaceae bacterium IS1]
MLLKNLFTSLSKDSPVFTTGAVMVGTMLWLLVFEVVLYLAIPYHSPPAAPNALQKYLEYGRSVEGKIRRLVGPTEEKTIPVTMTGWLDPTRWQTKPSQPKVQGGLLIAIYGMSFTQHVGMALEKVNPQVTVRFAGGPGVPPSHSYKLYQLDRGRHSAPVIALGISASSISGMTTFTGLNQKFEYPLPYTYPRYHKVGDHIEEIWPAIRTMDDFRRVLNDPIWWKKYIQELQAEDSYYRPFLFSENVMDNFVIFRFLRRSWSKRVAQEIKNSIYNPRQGFNENSEVIQTLRWIIKEFTHQVRSDGQLPLLMLFNNRGYADHLYQALAKTIAENDIPTLNSHTLVPADNPKSLARDGYHFSREVNRQFAEEVLRIIQQRRGQAGF